jgi:hypothetical protein
MKYIFAFIFLLFSLCSYSQNGNDLSQKELSSLEAEHLNHFGVATGPVYIINESEVAPGIHLHYMRLMEFGNAHFGIGLGLEAIFDEHRHYATSINFSYLPIHALTFTVAPGIQVAPESEDFTTHFEVVYEFEIGELHIGPVAEYAWSPNDAHAMLGLHIGCGF